MSATVEHKAETHRLARERLDAGLPVWDRKISFAGLFRNDDLSFTESRDAVVRKLRSSGWLKGRDECDDLVLLVGELADTEDSTSFNAVWDAIYDEADYDRVWITTR